jgi:hypothetical protein
MQDHGRCMVHPSHAMRVHLQHAREDAVYTVELFRNKRQGKLSFKKAMEGAKRWVYSSETTVR